MCRAHLSREYCIRSCANPVVSLDRDVTIGGDEPVTTTVQLAQALNQRRCKATARSRDQY